MDTRLTHNFNATVVTKIGLCLANYLDLLVSVANSDKVPASAVPPVTPRILQLNFFFSLLAKIRALPFLFLFPLAKP